MKDGATLSVDIDLVDRMRSHFALLTGYHLGLAGLAQLADNVMKEADNAVLRRVNGCNDPYRFDEGLASWVELQSAVRRMVLARFCLLGDAHPGDSRRNS